MSTVNAAVKSAKSRLQLPDDAMSHARKIGPFLLLSVLLVYMLLGAAVFLSFEHSNHEHSISKFYLNFGVRRRQFARQMTRSLFDKTDNMLVIVDQTNTQRIQDLLNKQLRDYENELPLQLPNREAWTMTNSLNYAWGLLTTLGHGTRSPQTTGGQVFALLYSLFGVPFFMLTLLICACSTLKLIRWLLRKRFADKTLTDVHLLAAAVGIYVWLVLVFTILLYSSAISDSFWRSLYTAILSAFSTPTAEYADFSEPEKLLILTAATLLLYMDILIAMCILRVYSFRYEQSAGAMQTQTTPTVDSAGLSSAFPDNINVVHSETVKHSAVPQPAPRFQVIVDHAGSSTLRNSADESQKKIYHY